MFVAILRYLKPIEEVERVLPAHRRFVDEGYAARGFLASGPQIPRVGDVILARAESAEALRRELAQDPMVTGGVAEYEVIEFMPTRISPWLFGHLG